MIRIGHPRFDKRVLCALPSRNSTRIEKKDTRSFNIAMDFDGIVVHGQLLLIQQKNREWGWESRHEIGE